MMLVPPVPLDARPPTSYGGSTAEAAGWRDDGLAHNHAWAGSLDTACPATGHWSGPTVTDPAAVRTPSSALHDDVHYAA